MLRMIFSLDGRRVVTYHLSSQDSAVASLRKMTSLHFAYKLDDALILKVLLCRSASAFKVEGALIPCLRTKRCVVIPDASQGFR